MHTGIIAGLLDPTMQTNVLRRTPTPTLPDLIQICLAEEAAQTVAPGLPKCGGLGSGSSSVQAVSTYKKARTGLD